MFVLTRKQREALKDVYTVHVEHYGIKYLPFRRQCFVAFGDCLMVSLPWITLGIETDGYTHS